MRTFNLSFALIGAVLSPLFLASQPAVAAPAPALRVGVARIDSTPTDLTGLTTLWRKQFAGVHDPIYVRALVLESGGQSAAIVATDLVEYGDTVELRERIAKETGIPADHVILTASHDHASPRVGTVTPGAQAQVGGQATVRYSAWLYDRILEAIKQAKASLQPARVAIDTGAADVNINRDEYVPGKGWTLGLNPAGHSDKTVWVVKFETAAGEPIAVLFNYAVHSVIAGPDNDQLTGDLAGAAERHVEQHFKGKVVALFTIGAAGDQNPKFIGPGQAAQEAIPSFDAIAAEGLMLGAEVVRVANRMGPATASVDLKAAERILTCPTKPPSAAMAGPGMGQQQAKEIKIHLGLIRLGNIAFTSVSGEVATNIYWHLRKASPLQNTLMITLANDRIGYIVDDATYDTPVFELNGSPLARGCAENGIVNNLVEMMGESMAR